MPVNRPHLFTPTFLPHLPRHLTGAREVLPLWEKEKNLLEWVRRHVPSRPVEDLHRDLTDGVVLCGLLEAVIPGACPRYDLLARSNPAANLRIASRLAAAFLGVTQVTEGLGRCRETWEAWEGSG